MFKRVRAYQNAHTNSIQNFAEYQLNMALESNMAGCRCEADSHKVTLVELKPEDIPGAVVTDKEIGKLEL